jgi:hypothetical protein
MNLQEIRNLPESCRFFLAEYRMKKARAYAFDCDLAFFYTICHNDESYVLYNINHPQGDSG